MAATAIQRRGGNTAQHANFTGLAREITIDTDKNTVVVHDGATAGGHPLATAADLANISGTVGNIVADITSVIAGNGLTGGASSGDANLNVGAGDGITVNADNVAVNVAFVRNQFSATSPLSYDAVTGAFSITEVGDISAVTAGNGLTGGGSSGAVTLDIGSGYGITVSSDAVAVSNVDVRALFSAAGDLSYNASTGVFSFTNDLGDIESVTAGDGLTGGGTSGNVTLNIGAGTGITVNADDVAVNASYVKGLFSVIDAGGDGSFAYNDSTGVYTYNGPSQAEANARMDAYLVGGGGLTYASGTFAVGAGTGITVNADNVAVNMSAFSTTNLSEGTNLYYTTNRANSAMDAYLLGGAGLTYASGTFTVGAGTGITVNADDVAVNATYIKGLFSATDAGGDGSFSYNNGVFTYTGPSAAEANARMDAYLVGGAGLTYTSGTFAVGAGTGVTVNADNVAVDASYITGLFSASDAGGDGSFSYNNGVFTYTGPSQAEANARIDARLSGGTGVSYSSGVISIGQAVATTSNVTFNNINSSGNVVIDGNLTVNGNTTTISATNLAIDDNLIYLNSNSTITNPDLGFVGNYNDGAYAHTGLFRDATDARWKFFQGYTPEPGQTIDTSNASFALADVQANVFYGSFVGNITGNVSTLGNFTTTNLAEGTNLYFTAARVRGNVSATTATGISYDSGTGVFSLSSIPNSSLTNSSVTINGSAIALGGSKTFTTSDIGEGTNLYYTTARANTAMDAYLVGGAGLTYTSGTFAVGAGAGITVNADNIALTSGIVTAGTYGGLANSVPSVTVDTYGRVTGTSNTTISITASQVSNFSSASNSAMDAYLVGGAGLTYTSGTLAVGAGAGITVNADNVALSTSGVASGTYGNATAVGQVVVDTYGRITSASNVTVTPAVGSITGLGTGVATALAVNTGSSGAVVVNGGALGTPSSGTLTNATGLPVATGISGLGAGVATFLATPSSANLAAAVTDETGSGSLVFATSPSLTTPTLGVASATSINKVAITAPATSANLTLADGSTLATSGAFALTLTTTAASNVTFPTSGTLATLSGTETLSNKTLSAPVLGTPTSGTLTNCTGLPVSTGISGLGSGVATWLATPTSANLRSVVTDETGGGVLVFNDAPSFTTSITTPAIVKSGSNGVGDIGQSSNTFATVYATTFSGTSTTAKYADLAEKYSADAEYEPGTVLAFGGDAEVTLAAEDMTTKVAGVVTTNPAHLMNSGLEGTAAAIALQGRVPCKVVGAVAKGDMMVAAGNGRARAEANPKMGSVIGKALENFIGGEGVIEVAVGRL